MYIGATEISLLLPAHVSIGTSTEPVTIGEVASMIVEISADLDVTAAAAGYTTPIPTTASAGYAAFQLATKQGVGARILGIIFPNLGGSADKTSLAADYRDAYLAFKKSLTKGDILIDGAGSSTLLPRSFSTSYPNEPGSGASPPVPFWWTP